MEQKHSIDKLEETSNKSSKFPENDVKTYSTVDHHHHSDEKETTLEQKHNSGPQNIEKSEDTTTKSSKLTEHDVDHTISDPAHDKPDHLCHGYSDSMSATFNTTQNDSKDKPDSTSEGSENHVTDDKSVMPSDSAPSRVFTKSKSDFTHKADSSGNDFENKLNNLAVDGEVNEDHNSDSALSLDDDSHNFGNSADELHNSNKKNEVPELDPFEMEQRMMKELEEKLKLKMAQLDTTHKATAAKLKAQSDQELKAKELNALKCMQETEAKNVQLIEAQRIKDEAEIEQLISSKNEAIEVAEKKNEAKKKEVHEAILQIKHDAAEANKQQWAQLQEQQESIAIDGMIALNEIKIETYTQIEEAKKEAEKNVESYKKMKEAELRRRFK